MQFGSLLDVKYYFGPLVLWQILATNNKTRPNEVQKLDIFGNKAFVHDNDRLYTVNTLQRH